MDLKDVAKRTALFHYDPRQLYVLPGFNSRAVDDPANRQHIEELAGSIAQLGVRQPLTVFIEDDKVFVSDGHCRLAATLLAIERGADIKTVPVLQEPRGANEADRVFSQIVRNSGKPLTAFEQGAVYKRLVGFGWTVAQIAEKSGKSISHINQALDFQEAPDEVHKLVTSGQISATLAAKVVRKSGKKEGAAALAMAASIARDAGKPRVTEKQLPPTASPERQIDRLMSAWEAAGSEVRERFLATVSAPVLSGELEQTAA
jgi:ParB family transcriptional regulator, chromosome partitioning protein